VINGVPRAEKTAEDAWLAGRAMTTEDKLCSAEIVDAEG